MTVEERKPGGVGEFGDGLAGGLRDRRAYIPNDVGGLADSGTGGSALFEPFVETG